MSQQNRIQYYRKKLGLSQEELGEKVLVSRQTVSQWENGQTVPSVDSLICLRDIFGVSVDDILGLTPEQTEDAPKEEREEYTFRYANGKELDRIRRIRMRPIVFRLIFCIVFYIAVQIWALERADLTSGVILGFALIALILTILNLRNFRKSFKKNREHILASVYTFFPTSDGIGVSVKNANQPDSETRSILRDLRKVRMADEYCFIETNTVFYTLRRDDIKEDSELARCINSVGAAQQPSKPRNASERRIKNAASLVLIFSLISIFMGFTLQSFFYGVDRFYLGSWMLYLFLPIPIASIVLGVILNRKGLAGKANIIIGVIVCAALCIYGSFFIMIGEYEDAAEAVKSEIGLELPDYEYYTSSSLTDEKGKPTVHLRIEFPRSSALEFESGFDGRWLEEIPDELVDSVPYTGSDNITHFLLYDRTSGSYNTVPENGSPMIILMYDAEYGVLNIVLFVY